MLYFLYHRNLCYIQVLLYFPFSPPVPDLFVNNTAVPGQDVSYWSNDHLYVIFHYIAVLALLSAIHARWTASHMTCDVLCVGCCSVPRFKKWIFLIALFSALLLLVGLIVVKFWTKVGRISPKWDKSRTFQINSVHFGSFIVRKFSVI